MQLTFETYWQGECHLSAVGRIMDDSLGYKGPPDVEYELDYFINKAAIDFQDEELVRDARALSVNYPVSLDRKAIRVFFGIRPEGWKWSASTRAEALNDPALTNVG